MVEGVGCEAVGGSSGRVGRRDIIVKNEQSSLIICV